jgi:hypothetical protein
VRDHDKPWIRTIPSSDAAFVALVDRITAEGTFRTPGELGRRLRKLFPRVLVRDRALSGEGDVWYVYRDGAWRPNGENGQWWARPGLPRIAVTPDGLVRDANRIALGLLGIAASDLPLHFSEFVAPGTLTDATALFEIVRSGRELVATVLLRPRGGELIACDVRADHAGEETIVRFRLAADIDVSPGTGHVPAALVSRPVSDPVFRQFAERTIATMADPTPQRLELALRRLYPHARVTRRAEDDTWEAFRDADAEAAGVTTADAGSADAPTPGAEWWRDPALPRLRYDMRGLILDANDAATSYLGRQLVGHHWQEFVTPTAGDVVSPVLDIIRRAGVAVSRFRMPTGDGTLVEFDSYTTADGDTLTTVMRPA